MRNLCCQLWSNYLCCTQFSLYWCYMNMIILNIIIIYDDYYYSLIIKKLGFV